MWHHVEQWKTEISQDRLVEASEETAIEHGVGAKENARLSQASPALSFEQMKGKSGENGSKPCKEKSSTLTFRFLAVLRNPKGDKLVFGEVD